MSAAAEPSVMRVPQGILLAASEIARDDFTRGEPIVTRGVFPVAEDIHHWRIVPREAPLALVLPIQGSSGITVESVSRALSTGTEAQRLEARTQFCARMAHEARLVLCGGTLMSYLTTWALWASEPDAAGRFLVTPSNIADLRGFKLHETGKTKTYGKPMSSFKRDIATLTSCGVSATSEIQAKSVEPLIQLYEVVRGGVYYRHAPILVDTILMKAADPAGFAQVPMRAIRLGAHDARAVVGLAALWRPVAAAKVWRGTLQDLAVQLGVFRTATQRAAGRNYWLDLARNLIRIAGDGGFGHLYLESVDPSAKTPVVLTPSPELADAYQRLRDARERARSKADVVAQEAAVRRRLPRTPRRRA